MSEVRRESGPCLAGALVLYDSKRPPQLPAIFENGNPIEVEIGCGKAKFLIPRAQMHPEINFLGIDIAWKWMKIAIERTEKRDLENLKFIRADARETLKHSVPRGSVSIFHIYFPDPWPKRRHRKRRLITGDFLSLLHGKLVEGGLIEIATDHFDYFQRIREAIVYSGIRWARAEERVNERLFDAHSQTNYEIKYGAAGRDLYYVELRK